MKTAILTFPVLLSVCYACSSDKDTTKDDSDKSTDKQETTVDDASDTPDEQEVTQAPKSISLKGKFLKEDEYGSRLYAVLLTVDGKTTSIDTVYACEAIPAKTFSQYDIPKEAKSACGGWWAGAGDYFYATLEKNKVVVYQGWQDEQQEDEGYHWKAMKLKE